MNKRLAKQLQALESKMTSDEMKRAEKADLITLPPSVEGTNCGNCRFFSAGHCGHKEVQMPVTARQCCAYWDNEVVKRPWEK